MQEACNKKMTATQPQLMRNIWWVKIIVTQGAISERKWWKEGIQKVGDSGDGQEDNMSISIEPPAAQWRFSVAIAILLLTDKFYYIKLYSDVTRRYHLFLPTLRVMSNWLVKYPVTCFPWVSPWRLHKFNNLFSAQNIILLGLMSWTWLSILSCAVMTLGVLLKAHKKPVMLICSLFNVELIHHDDWDGDPLFSYSLFSRMLYDAVVLRSWPGGGR